MSKIDDAIGILSKHTQFRSAGEFTKKIHAWADRVMDDPTCSAKKLATEACDFLGKACDRLDAVEKENMQLKKTIEEFGKNPAGFDWAVLDKLDAQQQENQERTLDNDALRMEINILKGIKQVHPPSGELKYCKEHRTIHCSCQQEIIDAQQQEIERREHDAAMLCEEIARLTAEKQSQAERIEKLEKANKTLAELANL